MFLSNSRYLKNGLLPLAFILLLAVGQAHAAEAAKNFLWSVTAQNQTLYLLGSIHILNRDAYPLAPPILKAYAESDKLVFETDIQELSSFKSQATMMLRGLLPKSQSLEQSITQETYALLKDHLQANGHDISTFARLKPWMCAMTLTMMEFKKAGMHTDYGIESYLLLRSIQDGKRLGGLVPVQEHLDILSAMDNDEQEMFLRQTILDLAKAGEITTGMQQAWKQGDHDKLAALLKESFHENPQIYDQLLVQRNRKWLPTIEKLLAGNEKILVVVGAGHLVGKDSVIDLLTQRGYSVIQH